MLNFSNHSNWYSPPNFRAFMPQVQSPQPSYLGSAEPAQQEVKISEEIKAKRERWTARQAEVLVSLWVENFEVLESSRCNQVWPKLVNKVCSLGPAKTLKQCKVKIRNLKDAYKKYKDESKQSGNERRSFPATLFRRRYDVASQTSFQRRLQDVINQTSSRRRRSDVFKTT